MFLQMSQLLAPKSAGKRGRVWSCLVCPYKGEKHMVRKHVFDKHMEVTEWPYCCGLCGYAHHQYKLFEKHVRWYEIHIRQAALCRVPFQLQREDQTTPASNCHLQLMRMLTVEESVAHWEERRRTMDEQLRLRVQGDFITLPGLGGPAPNVPASMFAGSTTAPCGQTMAISSSMSAPGIGGSASNVPASMFAGSTNGLTPILQKIKFSSVPGLPGTCISLPPTVDVSVQGLGGPALNATTPMFAGSTTAPCGQATSASEPLQITPSLGTPAIVGPAPNVPASVSESVSGLGGQALNATSTMFSGSTTAPCRQATSALTKESIPAASMPVSDTVLTEEEKALVDEFLVPGDDQVSLHVSSEEASFLEPERPLTKDQSTQTPRTSSLMRCEELQLIIRQQRRTLEENTAAIHVMRRLLEQRGLEIPEDPQIRRVHHGVGSGEIPNVVRQRRPTPPRQRIRSVVYQMPRRQRPRPVPEFRRPSPLDGFFTPDPPVRRRPATRSHSPATKKRKEDHG